jgi:hypothetical protein
MAQTVTELKASKAKIFKSCINNIKIALQDLDAVLEGTDLLTSKCLAYTSIENLESIIEKLGKEDKPNGK